MAIPQLGHGLNDPSGRKGSAGSGPAAALATTIVWNRAASSAERGLVSPVGARLCVESDHARTSSKHSLVMAPFHPTNKPRPPPPRCAYAVAVSAAQQGQRTTVAEGPSSDRIWRKAQDMQHVWLQRPSFTCTSPPDVQMLQSAATGARGTQEGAVAAGAAGAGGGGAGAAGAEGNGGALTKLAPAPAPTAAPPIGACCCCC